MGQQKYIKKSHLSSDFVKAYNIFESVVAEYKMYLRFREKLTSHMHLHLIIVGRNMTRGATWSPP